MYNDFQMVTQLLPTSILSITGENSQQANGIYAGNQWLMCHGVCSVSMSASPPSSDVAQATIRRLFTAEAWVQPLCSPSGI